MRIHAGVLATAWLSVVSAVFLDDARHIDFHFALLGSPQRDATFFHKPYASSKASLLYTISDNGTTGAVNPKDGALVWRSTSRSHGRGHLRAGDEQDTVIGASGGHVTAWSASDGRIAWEGPSGEALVEDLELLQQEDGLSSKDAKDVVVLRSGSVPLVERLDGKNGRVRWKFEDLSGDTPFQISTSPTTVYYISLHSPLLGAGSKLRVTSINSVTGKKIDSYTLSSESEIQGRENILFAGANTAAPLLAWTDKANKVLKVNIIGNKAISTFNTPAASAVEKIVLHAPGRVNSLTHFLVEYQTATGHSADVYHVDLRKNAIAKAYSLPHLGDKGTFATSTSDANVFFVRITAEETIVYSSASHGVLGRWPIKTISSLHRAHPVSAVSEVVVKGTQATAVRSAVLFSNGQWALIRNSDPAWTRPEFLAGTLSAVWVSTLEQETLAQQLELENHQNIISAYVHRVQRHIIALQHFPSWLQSLPLQIIDSLTGKYTDAPQQLHHDSFGFHKPVVVATRSGRLAALDVGSNGQVMWNTDLHELAPDATFVSPSLRAGRGYVEVRDPSFTGTLYINTTTGGLLSSHDIEIRLPFEEKDQTLVSFELVDGQMKGSLGTDSNSNPIWTFTPPTGERIIGYTTRPYADPIASVGKVLGDRRVLYKYLNPNLALVTAVADASRRISLYLLDSASGQVLYTASHDGVDTSRAVPATMSENWFSYSFSVDSEPSVVSRGYQLVIAELYESPLPDDRGPLGAASNASVLTPAGAAGEAPKPHVLTQSYQTPEEIAQMTVTQTRQGITSRELLVTLPASNSIVGIPRQMIDPRRPVGRDPTAMEQSEGLARYFPMLLFDPKWYLNHQYELVGIKDVITSESAIESTSLVFAYGQDIFGTRVAPSFAFDMLGKSFNKAQMSLTVAALFIGVLFVAPLVRRKQINAVWTAPQ